MTTRHTDRGGAACGRTASADRALLIRRSDAQLRNLDLQTGANVPGFLADAMVQLGHARERADAHLDGLEGLVRAAPTGAAVADSLWREHEITPRSSCVPRLAAGPTPSSVTFRALEHRATASRNRDSRA